MSFATAIRNRNSDRLIALVTAIGVVMSLMVIFAQPAQAHHPEIEATDRCVEATGVTTLTFTANSWTTSASEKGNHEDVRIEVSTDSGSTWHQAGTAGAFLEGTRTFTRTFTGTDVVFGTTTVEDLEGTTIIVRSRVVPADWDSNPSTSYNSDQYGTGYESGWYEWDGATKEFGGATGNGNNAAQHTLNIDPCEPPEKKIVQTNGIVGECELGEGGAFASVQVTVDPSGGATVNIYDDAAKGADDLVASFTANGDVNLDPGTYYWEVIVSPGYVHGGDDPLEGDFTIDDCEDTTTTTDRDRETTTTPPSTTPPTTPEILPTSITAAPTTIAPVDTLPFTGVASGTYGLLALALIGIGALALVATRRAED